MAPPQSSFPPAAEDGDEINHVLEVARDALAHEFHVSERLDEKARGQMTLAGAWFGLVQAVAGITLGAGGVSSGWGAAVAGSAIIASFALGWAFYRHYAVWKLRDETGFNADALHAFGEWASDEETNLGGTLIGYYEQILSERQGRNRERVEEFDKAVPAWFFTLGLTLVELLIALFAAISI